MVPASRLGWRVTPLFAAHFLGRLFDTPAAVFPDEVLRPELQSLADFADGVLNIAEAQERVARMYIEDGSIETAIPPLEAILRVMAEGSWKGKGLENPELRALFDRDYVLGSGWYRARLERYRDREAAYLEESLLRIRETLQKRGGDPETAKRLKRSLEAAEAKLALVRKPAYLEALIGTIGRDPLFRG